MLKKTMLKYINVDPDNNDHLDFLYLLLSDRPDNCRISHRKMPSFEEHCKFVQSRPYLQWKIIYKDNHTIGSYYITAMGEVGIFISSEERRKGYGTKALNRILWNHKSETFLANINPLNEVSIRLFEALGFKHIQNTYRRDPA